MTGNKNVNSDDFDLIGAIYDASYQPSSWSKVLSAVAELTDSTAAVLLYYDRQIKSASIFCSTGLSAQLIKTYHEHYSAHDPFFELSLKTTPIGVASADHQMIPDRQKLEQHCGEFYTDYMRCFDIKHIGGATLFADEDRSAAIAVNRGKAQGPWSDAELQRITDLVPHLQRALRIHREFALLRATQDAMRLSLERMIMGVVLFDIETYPIYINAKAKSILTNHPAIGMRRDQLVVTDSKQNNQLKKLIWSAVRAKTAEQPIVEGVMGLRHPQEPRALPVLVTPVQEGEFITHALEQHARAALLITDPESSLPISIDALMTAYALSPVEAQVAVGIANGIPLPTIAENHNTSLNTVRSQLKAVFR